MFPLIPWPARFRSLPSSRGGTVLRKMSPVLPQWPRLTSPSAVSIRILQIAALVFMMVNAVAFGV
jgi:hypothetical protein